MTVPTSLEALVAEWESAGRGGAIYNGATPQGIHMLCAQQQTSLTCYAVLHEALALFAAKEKP